MSVNERWVVYPLLFLSLGVALRDKVIPRVELEELTANQVRCNRLSVAEADCSALHVAGPQGNGGVRLGVLPDGTGRIEVHNGSDHALVALGSGPSGYAGTVTTFDVERNPQVRLLATESGGALATFDREGNVLLLGRAGSQAGLWGVTPQLRDARLLSSPWSLGAPAAIPQGLAPQPAPSPRSDQPR